MNEKELERMVEKYRDRLEGKYESYVDDKLSDWLGGQDDEPTTEAVEAKRSQLEDNLSSWINGQVEKYKHEQQDENKIAPIGVAALTGA